MNAQTSKFLVNVASSLGTHALEFKNIDLVEQVNFVFKTLNFALYKLEALKLL